jgi:hypothetical protein
MIKNNIGTNATKISRMFINKAESTFEAIMKYTEMDETELLLALGWLACKNKVIFCEKDGQQVVYWMPAYHIAGQ